MSADTPGDNSVDNVDKTLSGSASGPEPPENMSDSVPESGTHGGGELRGPDLARQALEAARAKSAARDRQQAKHAVYGKRKRARRRGWSGARPDDRDPQPLGRLTARIIAERGWKEHLTGGSVIARWPELVGEEVAAHSVPEQLKGTELHVRAESTAWATQLRLLQRQLIKRFAEKLGDGVVTSIKVAGPAAPSWRYGPRHVPGRGPRDTYG